MHGQTTQDTRQFFTTCWQKYLAKQALEPLEQQIVDVLMHHPEYHTLIASGETEAVYFPEMGQSNPFLHMGLHLTIRDQVATNRPVGITMVFQTLLVRHQDPHVAEHLMMEPLAECLWKAQRSQSAPDERAYLQACEALYTCRE